MEVVTGAMGSLLPKLGELLVGEYKLLKGVKKDVESLEREMKSMNAALVKMAEVPRDQLDNQVIIWADELRELSYDMEDVVDNFLVCAEGSQSDAIADSNNLKRLVGKMANLFTKGKTRHQIGNAIRDIKNRAQEVADRRDRYKVDGVVTNPAGKQKIDPRVLALYKDQKELVGIEDARDELTKMLTDDDGPKQQQHKMKIVSIIGPGGLGKTTLAKAVYDRLQTQFTCTTFVLVGRDPEVKKVLRDIILEVDKNKCMGDLATLDETQLISKLRRLLENARYLIVIDDIWDLKAWDIIKCALLDNNHVSRVITTTRILDVAKNTGDIYKLKPLSHHLSEELFYTRLFGGKDKCPFDHPAEVSSKILQKCGGLPLAIITLASLLAGKPMENWSKVFNSIGFGSGDNNKDVENTRKILSFSYYDLPCHLRSCLLHLSVYPEDDLIMKDTLIWQWVAEGFVIEEPGVSLFETGERYFNELLNRSMIQPVEDSVKYTIYACCIHDMVLDIICLFSKEQNFVTILDSNEEHTPSQCNARRLAVQKRVLPLTNMNMPKLRSDRPYHLEHIGRLPQLRYLSLQSTHISKLPEEIGNLKFLQTLDLRGTDIRELPQSIGLLRKLKQTQLDRFSFKPIHARMRLQAAGLPDRYELVSAIHTRVHGTPMDRNRSVSLLGFYFFCSGFSLQGNHVHVYIVPILPIHGRLGQGYMSVPDPVLPNRDYIQQRAPSYYWEDYKPSRQLRDLAITGSFRRFPTWINSMFLPNLSILTIFVDDLGKQDVVNLGSLPELTVLLGKCVLRGMEFPNGTDDEEESDSEQTKQEFLLGSMESLECIDIRVRVLNSDNEDENRPGPHLTESSDYIAGTSPPVPAQRQAWRRWACFACLNSGSSNSAAPATAGSKQCGGSGQGMGCQEAEDDNEAAQP
ncbi:hypothetical protein VPH35_107624 [Triticum aestivum]